MKQVGVVLSGCGVYDGTEIHEAVLTLLALDRAGAQAVCFAPDKPQLHSLSSQPSACITTEMIRIPFSIEVATKEARSPSSTTARS